jgi:membrane-anchored glycerophosphoryl diester phosphodiesterase (GDPDase)
MWRFVRLFVIFLIVAAIVGGIIFGIQTGLLKATDQNENERLPVFIQLGGLAIIFLVLTVIRIWFDLAQTDVVLRDQGAVRKSVSAGWRMMKRNLGRLLGNYVVISLVALAVLVAGIWLWYTIVPASSVLGAFLISQIMLLLLLAMRFWQRATAVAFYTRIGEETELETEKPALVAAIS